MSNISESKKEKAQAAINKKAAMGEDIDLGQFTRSAEEHPYRKDPSELTAATKSKMLCADRLAQGGNIKGFWRKCDIQRRHTCDIP